MPLARLLKPPRTLLLPLVTLLPPLAMPPRAPRRMPLLLLAMPLPPLAKPPRRRLSNNGCSGSQWTATTAIELSIDAGRAHARPVSS